MSVGSTNERRELLGQTLDAKYHIRSCIGVGGTGIVFDARNLATGEQVVVKTMRPHFAHNGDLLERLRREVEVARAVQHAGLASVYDEGFLHDGSPYLVMERLHGESLSRLLLRIGVLSEDETAMIGIRVASILHAVHRAGYTHRDVKPEHILINLTGDQVLDVRLLDFGVCTSIYVSEDERRRERGRVFGTPSYVSPEQACGIPTVDGRADLYGLGVVLYECVAGKVPFSASNVGNLLRRIIREDVPPVTASAPHISAEFASALQHMLSRNPEDRPATARSVARMLTSFVPLRASAERRLGALLRPGSEMPTGQATVRMKMPSQFAA